MESLLNKVVSLQAWNFILNEAPTQVFSCEIYEIIDNTYFEEHLRTSVFWKILLTNFNSTLGNSIKDCIFLAVLLVEGFTSRVPNEKSWLLLLS